MPLRSLVRFLRPVRDTAGDEGPEWQRESLRQALNGLRTRYLVALEVLDEADREKKRSLIQKVEKLLQTFEAADLESGGSADAVDWNEGEEAEQPAVGAAYAG